MCTSDAVRGGFCSQSQLGRFILDLPEGRSINDTSFWSARVAFPAAGSSSTTTSEAAPSSDVTGKGFWNNPAGNPEPPDENSEYSSPWRRDVARVTKRQDGSINPSPSGIHWYREPIQYLVRNTGYYCVGMFNSFCVPLLEPHRALQPYSGRPRHCLTVIHERCYRTSKLY